MNVNDPRCGLVDEIVWRSGQPREAEAHPVAAPRPLSESAEYAAVGIRLQTLPHGPRFIRERHRWRSVSRRRVSSAHSFLTPNASVPRTK